LGEITIRQPQADDGVLPPGMATRWIYYRYRNKDGGVDVRVWTDQDSKTGPPLMLIQCKRYKDVVGIETVKAFWSDVHSKVRKKV
jgi:hypothetical protein